MNVVVPISINSNEVAVVESVILSVEILSKIINSAADLQNQSQTDSTPVSNPVWAWPIFFEAPLPTEVYHIHRRIVVRMIGIYFFEIDDAVYDKIEW